MSRNPISRILVVLGAALLLSANAAAAGTTWQIDPRHSSAQFAVRHLAISTVRGEFHKVNGTIVVDDKDISKSTVDVTIDTTTVDTREPDRDKHLKSPDFFDVEKFPTVTFTSTSVTRAADGKLQMTGDLTMHGVTKSVTLDVKGPSPATKNPMGMMMVGFSASGKVNRKDFGLTWNKTLDGGGVLVSDEVTLAISAEFQAPQATAK